MDAAGVKEDTLAQRGLARVDVGADTDIPQFLQIHLIHLTIGRSASWPIRTAAKNNFTGVTAQRTGNHWGWATPIKFRVSSEFTVGTKMAQR